MRFGRNTNAADKARENKRADTVAACSHRFARFNGDALDWEPPADCFGYLVPADASYHVERCTSCGYRRDVSDTGEIVREYDRPHRTENVYVEPSNDPGDYVPRFDGIDAFNEAEDTSDTSALFDARGGSDGIGDVSFPTIED